MPQSFVRDMSSIEAYTEKKKSTAPKLRFKEFRGEWHVEALESHIDILSGVPLKGEEISEDDKGVPILRGINITEGFVRHSKDIDRYYLNNTKELERFLVEEGDLVIGMDGSKVGKNAALISKSDSGSILIQRVARIRNKPTSDIRFIYHHIFSPKFHRYVDEVNTSSGIPHISLKQINEFEIGFPSLPEQQKIASFLSAVDEKIQQLTRKKELLAEYKRGVMQQLFSGKLRFKDANGKAYPKWEEKKLGDVLEIGSGRDYKHLGQGNIPVFGTGGLMTMVNDFLYDGETVCIGRKGTIDKPMYHVGKIWTVDTLFYTHSFKNSLPKFVYYVFQLINWREHNEASGVPSLSKTTIEKLKFKFPSVEEQQKIASFLTALDAKIESVAAQIAHTQTFKKGLLQQMFV